MSDFHTLKVQETKSLIDGMAKSVMFDVPPELTKIFIWKAGQHLTLRFKLNGEEVRRSYSISSSPYSGDPLRITVKRVKDGLVSNHINDNVNAGDDVEVMPPFGGFYLQPGETKRRTHYFFGAGSGITPLFSMLHSVICAEPYSAAYLAYGNKNGKTIIFKDAFEQLCDKHENRLKVLHVLSNPSMWSSFTPWRKGIVDKQAIETLINENPPYAQDAQYYICGPGGMNKAVKAALMSLDVPAERIHMESYGGSVDVDDSIKGQAATAQIKLNSRNRSININEDQTILEAAREAGFKPPFSCQSGVCGACRATLENGTVHMRARMALEDSEIEKGAILTCQSVATSKELVVSYD